MRDLLESPCVFCSFSGEGYWKSGTHAMDCPWRGVTGSDGRWKVMLAGLKQLMFLHLRKASNEKAKLATPPSPGS